jgi:hypothetical protein
MLAAPSLASMVASHTAWFMFVPRMIPKAHLLLAQIVAGAKCHGKCSASAAIAHRQSRRGTVVAILLCDSPVRILRLTNAVSIEAHRHRGGLGDGTANH